VNAVVADSLVVRFDALTAVDDVSLEIERSEVFGLLGPNGAGKTTTLRVLTTLLKPLAIGTAAFACLSMLIASTVKERERFMGIGQLVMMPLFFASSALYPLAIMPGWLKVVAHVNPLTYEVEGLRGFLLGGGHPFLDLLVCVGWLVVLATAATGAYPRALL
jgi:ABC-2 type transport system permease protein